VDLGLNPQHLKTDICANAILGIFLCLCECLKFKAHQTWLTDSMSELHLGVS